MRPCLHDGLSRVNSVSPPWQMGNIPTLMTWIFSVTSPLELSSTVGGNGVSRTFAMNGAHKFKASRANALTSLPWFPLIIPSVSMQDLKVHTDKERTGKAF